MNEPKYPELRQHQELFNTTGFLTKPAASSEPLIALLQTQNRDWRNVSRFSPNATRTKLLVRVYAAGTQITIGQLREKNYVNYVNAWRLADMATLFFWKYRMRGGSQPGEDRFNISSQQAQLDLENEIVHRDLLRDYENILIGLKVLPTAEALAVKKQPKAESKAANLEARMTSVERLLTDSLTENRAWMLTVRGLIERVSTQIEALGTSIDTSTVASNTLNESRDRAIKQIVIVLEQLTRKVNS
jgi:hypothetical protein